MIRFFMPLAAICGLGLLANSASAALVNVAYAPTAQTVQVGDTIQVNLLVQSDGSPQPFAAIDALIGYDPAFLKLTSSTQANAGASFFVTGFLPDPDGININIGDGEAKFTALAPPGAPISAPAAPGQLVVTTFNFLALAQVRSTSIQLILQDGNFGHTQVLLNGANITGDISSIATVNILPVQGACCMGCDCLVTGERDCGTRGGTWAGAGTDCDPIGNKPSICTACLGDINNDGVVNVDDLLAVINNWGPSPPGDCHADVNHSGTINVDDLLAVINGWGPCP